MVDSCFAISHPSVTDDSSPAPSSSSTDHEIHTQHTIDGSRQHGSSPDKIGRFLAIVNFDCNEIKNWSIIFHPTNDDITAFIFLPQKFIVSAPRAVDAVYQFLQVKLWLL
mmetsp:Transcript_36741/g.44926  ORF Transcript_36741/g.44926 Transcript_36741/m.44926 type:complete len:110 (+) Transcript_36741:304-633(+)